MAAAAAAAAVGSSHPIISTVYEGKPQEEKFLRSLQGRLVAIYTKPETSFLALSIDHEAKKTVGVVKKFADEVWDPALETIENKPVLRFFGYCLPKERSADYIDVNVISMITFFPISLCIPLGDKSETPQIPNTYVDTATIEQALRMREHKELGALVSFEGLFPAAPIAKRQLDKIIAYMLGLLKEDLIDGETVRRETSKLAEYLKDPTIIDILLSAAAKNPYDPLNDRETISLKKLHPEWHPSSDGKNGY